jgi:hypothetical protein
LRRPLLSAAGADEQQRERQRPRDRSARQRL